MKRGRSRLKHNNLCPDLILPPCFVLHAVGLAHLSLNHGLFIGAISSDCWRRSYDALDSSSLHPFFHSLFIYMPLFHAINLLCFFFSLHLIIFSLILQPLVADDWQMVWLPEPSSARGVSLLKETLFSFFKEWPSGRP